MLFRVLAALEVCDAHPAEREEGTSITFASILALALFVPVGPAQPPVRTDRTEVVRDIVVQPEEAARDVTCFGCSIRVLGNIHGDAVTLGGALEVRGRVRGDALALGGEIHLAPGAEITGDAIAFGGRVVVDPGARLSGQDQSLPYLPFPGQRRLGWRGVLGLVGINLAGAFFGFLLLRRIRLTALAARLTQHAALALLVGLLATVTALLLYQGAQYLGAATSAVMLLVTLGVAVIWMAGFAGISATLGARLRAKPGPARAVLLGAATITLLELIPLAGFVVWCVAALLAMGGALMTRFGRPVARSVPAEIAPPPAVV